MEENKLCFKPINPELRKYGPILRGRIVILDGLIAAGKSTAGIELQKYAQSLGIPSVFFPEPLIPDLLKLFLSDQKKYAFAFQLAMLVKRQKIYHDAQEYAKKGYFCVIDRSLFGDYCFALMHKNRGNISEDVNANPDKPSEWISYLTTMKSEQFEYPDYVVYLKVNEDVAIERCKVRDRDGEKTYDRQYFSELLETYASVLPSSPSKQFITVDWNEPRTKEQIPKVILDEIKKLYDNNGGI